VNVQTANDRIKQEDTTSFGVKGRRHFVGAALDLAKEPLDDVVGADGFPVLLRIGIKGQASLQIALQARDGGWIHPLVLLEKGTIA
jgi:hypothetical protein